MKPAVALALGLILAGCATRPNTASVTGYLPSSTLDDLAGALLSPAPARTLPEARPGTDRWWLATLHGELRPPLAAQHFDCALGARFAARPRPALTRLMTRLAVDSQVAAERAAARQHIPRPIAQPDPPQACQRVTPDMRMSPSWPASGAVLGAAYGALMADLAPERALEALAIGHAIAESRAICRMNWSEDVEAGERLGEAVFSAAAAQVAFQTDRIAAVAEVSAARAEGLTNPGCAAERRALRLRPGAG